MTYQHWFWIISESEMESKPIPSMKDIQRMVCRRFPGVTRSDILSERRTKDIVLPRQIAIFLARTITLKSMPAIGRAFKRDHTTILYGYRKIKRSMGNPFVGNLVADLMKELAA